MAISTTSLSRPDYHALLWKTGSAHLLVCDETGRETIDRFLASAGERHVTVLVLASNPGKAPRNAASLHQFDRAFSDLVARADMGLQLYACGAPGFLGRVTRLAREAGLVSDNIQAELSGVPALAAQCAHCKTIHDPVSAEIIWCDGCSHWLIIRQHYSRRLGACQAVWIEPTDPDFLRLRGEAAP